MQIQTLYVRGFRNLATQELELGPRFNVLSGDNAQGKSNLLEAIYLVACLKSFRARRLLELVGFDGTSALVQASVCAADLQRELTVRVSERGRQALLDGKVVRSSATYIASGFNVVLFTPDDVQVPRGSPALRRQLLDRAIATLWPPYLELARQYQRTLQSRNRVLREEQRSSGAQRALLEVFDEQLCQSGARVIAARQRYLRAIERRFGEVFEEIVRSGVKGALSYSSSPEVHEAKEEREALCEALGHTLRRARKQDLSRGQSTAGPHADDVEFTLDGRSTRSFGSQGQHRALMLAFKVTQIQDIAARRGDAPVLLLDDVSSELDALRNMYLFEFIIKINCQAFLTTTRPQLVALEDNRLDFQVVNGLISAQK